MLIPRAAKKFERLHKGRTSLERIKARRFCAELGTVLAVHTALPAAASRRSGPLGKLLAKALTEHPLAV